MFYTLTEFRIQLKLLGLIKMSLNETCSKDRTGKPFSNEFQIRNALKHGDAFALLLFEFA
jgi:hypothetical protein